MRSGLWIGLGVLALAVGIYAASPLWAGWQLRQAVRTRDIAALQARVDWPKLRANLKPRIADAISDNADTSGGLSGALKRIVGSALSGTAVDTLVTPENLGRVLAGRAFLLKPPAGAPAEKTVSGTPSETTASDDANEDPDDPMPTKRVRWAFFESPTRFRVEATNPRLPGSRIVSILALEGLAWKLVDIDIIKK